MERHPTSKKPSRTFERRMRPSNRRRKRRNKVNSKPSRRTTSFKAKILSQLLPLSNRTSHLKLQSNNKLSSRYKSQCQKRESTIHQFLFKLNHNQNLWRRRKFPNRKKNSRKKSNYHTVNHSTKTLRIVVSQKCLKMILMPSTLSDFKLSWTLKKNRMRSVTMKTIRSLKNAGGVRASVGEQKDKINKPSRPP